MVYQIASMVLCLFGLGAACVTLGLGIFVFWKQRRWTPLFYGGVALLYGAAMIRNLIVSASPYMCSTMPWKMFVIGAALFILHIYFIIDTVRKLPPEKSSLQKRGSL